MAKKATVEIDPIVLEKKVEMNNLIEDVKKLDEEIAHLDAVYEALTEKLREQYEDKKLYLVNKRKGKQDNIKALFELVPHQETKTQRKLMLLSGDVVVKKAKQDFERDNDQLLVWAKANQREDLITRKEALAFKWADFKKRLVPTDDGIVDKETGEYIEVEGLRVITKPEEVEIKY